MKICPAIKTRLIFTFLLAIASISFLPFPARALSINVHVPEKYTDVQAGERLYFELEIIYPENPARKDLRLEYSIVKDGEVVATSKFLKAVETQASFMDYVVIPDSAKTGLYEIKVHIQDYDQLNEEATASFHVVAKDDQLKTYFFIILGAIGLLGIVISLEIYRLKKMEK